MAADFHDQSKETPHLPHLKFALPIAWFRRQQHAGLIFAADHVSPCASKDHGKQLAAFNMTASLSR